jgi:hypothetical protein
MILLARIALQRTLLHATTYHLRAKVYRMALVQEDRLYRRLIWPFWKPKM